ncbi:MAG TPA: rhodanese-like domain-containing protein [Actinomycetota bacterium]|nr:rhodanese-like domain-containing protein [Actinomycetota bacterium]
MDDVRVFHDAGLGNGSYLADVGDGRGVLIDPDRRIRRYLEAARDAELDVVAVLDTHLHADFVSGSLDLRDRTGAELHEPAEAGVGFPHRPVKPGERVEIGRAEFEVLATPGHAPEHVSYVLRRDHAEPALFSGGALIVGGAARTDLAGAELTERLTRQEYETLHHAFAGLPDETELLPTHGGGSFCSTGAGGELTSTLGAERQASPLLSLTEEDFVTSWPKTFPRTPTHFARMREINWAGPRLRRDIELPRPLAPKAFAAAASEHDAIVLDTRSPGDHAQAHGQGALAIPFRDAFPTWLGWLVPADARLLLVLGDAPLEDVVDACLLVGFERFAGFLDGGIDAWREAGLPLRSLATIGAEDTVPWIQGGAKPLDVREPDEVERGTIAGATAIPLGDLPQRAADVPDGRPILVYCASGMRSTTAASILERAGIAPVVNLRGGYGAWREAGRD